MSRDFSTNNKNYKTDWRFSMEVLCFLSVLATFVNIIYFMKTNSTRHFIILILIFIGSLFNSGYTSAKPETSPTAVNIASCQAFPDNNFWNVPINNLPVHPNSAQWVNSIGSGTSFHMDFGSGTWEGGPIGIPYNIVSGASVNEYAFDFYYPTESDPGPYPLPAIPQIEWGGDHHILVVDTDDCKLYEIYDASFDGVQWSGGSGAIWDMDLNDLRPDSWTSADAAGLPILPGLARYEEISAGVIEHALRFTANCTADYYIWPARHEAEHSSCVTPVPFGARFRLKANYDISGFSPQAQVLLQAFKTYGIVLADNGSNWYVSGSPSESWDNDQLHELDVLSGSDFEAVDTSGLMVSYDSGTTGYTISGNAGAMGVILHYTDGTPKMVVADGNGNYALTVSPGWSGTVTPLLAGVTFDPPSLSYTNTTSNQVDQDYTAFVALSGNAGVAGATLSYFDGTPKTVVSDNNGIYTITVPCNWSGTVTPSRTGFSFVPASKSYTNLGATQSGQNYVASWVGGITITSDQNVVAVGRPHIGNEVASYGGFTSGSLSSYVPMLFKTAFGSYDSALYVQNVHASNTANITIKYYDSTGVLNCTKADTLAPLSSKGYWVPAATCDSGSLPAGWVGGVVVTSDQPIVAVGRPHVGSEVMTYDGFASGSLTTSLPMLFKGAFGGSYNAAFYLQNTHASNTANVTIKYYDSNGVLNCTKTDTIAALASKGYWVPAATCDSGTLPNGWVGGVVVTSDQPIVAVGRPHIGTQVTTYTGFPAGSLSSYVPMLFKGAFGSYDSAYYVQNVHESNTANITIKYYDSNGVLNCTKTDTIAPLASKGYWVPAATCDSGSLPAGWVGGVVVTSDQPIVAVGRPHIGTQVTTYNGFTSGSLNAYLPMLFRDGFGGSYDSALYLQNLHSSTTANLTIKLYDASGNLACTITDTLSALATKGYWLPALLCSP